MLGWLVNLIWDREMIEVREMGYWMEVGRNCDRKWGLKVKAMQYVPSHYCSTRPYRYFLPCLFWRCTHSRLTSSYKYTYSTSQSSS